VGRTTHPQGVRTLASPSTPDRSAALRDTAPPLGHATTRGFALMSGQVLAVKAINLIGQVILAWILDRRDYGFVALAYSVSAFIALIQRSGVREMLVQRGRHFAVWATPAFWFSLALGALCALLMVAMAPLAAAFYRDSRVAPLLLVLSLAVLLDSLNAVPESKLQIDLRFGLLAVTNLLTGAVAMASSILFAALGFGAFSFILPLLIANIIRLCIYWPVVRPPIRRAPAVHRWKYFIRASGLLAGASLLTTVTWQGDYIILGRLYPKEVVGLYFWAFNLSIQALYFSADAVAGVLFPSLTKLREEPQRQREAFERAARAIALLGIPACFLQMVLARPGVLLFFDAKWHPGIPLVQILSVGMAAQVVGIPALSALKAQGRFATALVWAAVCAAAFVAMVFAGAYFAEARGAAIAVACYCWISAPLSAYLVLRHLGGDWRSVRRIFACPLLCSAAAAACAILVSRALPPMRWGNVIQLALGSAIMGAIYLPAVRLLARDTWDDLYGKIAGLLSRGCAVAS